ncbi:uncharacterized protein LOC135222643 isoform X4 [Macrobrachium nipponense]
MQPRPILASSIINNSKLKDTRHPCRDIKVLWFGTQNLRDLDNEDDHDWYGNVQFATSAEILLKCWKYYYLVEMETKTRYTTSHLLVTNTNYSEVLPPYNPWKKGGPWYVDSDGHYVLNDCSRYNNEGSNEKGHVLEFMIEVTECGRKAILDVCMLSFRNHSASSFSSKEVSKCHQSRLRKLKCPSPIGCSAAARQFFDEHHCIGQVSSVAYPKLSVKAAKYLKLCTLSHGQRHQHDSVTSLAIPPQPKSPIISYLENFQRVLCIDKFNLPQQLPVGTMQQKAGDWSRVIPQNGLHSSQPSGLIQQRSHSRNFAQNYMLLLPNLIGLQQIKMISSGIASGCPLYYSSWAKKGNAQ